MAALGVVVGLFLAFSLSLAWVGGDREKAALEDTIRKGQWAQTAMSEAAQAQGEKINELQGRLEDSLIEKNKLERGAAAPADTDKGASAGNKPSNRFLDPEPSLLDDVESTDPLTAAEQSLRRESSARAEVEKRLVAGERAISYLEIELNELIEGEQGWRAIKASGALCPWDPERR
jgi:hypothetical protein